MKAVISEFSESGGGGEEKKSVLYKGVMEFCKADSVKKATVSRVPRYMANISSGSVVVFCGHCESLIL